MDAQVKICPECGAEYFAHVTNCSACEVTLIYPSENEVRSPPEGGLVCIEEGDYGRVTELAGGLTSSGMDFRILNIGKGSSCSGGGYGIFVQQSVAREAVRIIEDRYYKLYPELKETEERLTKGLCPACGADTKGASECPDCGLNLGGPGDDSCGGCTPCH